MSASPNAAPVLTYLDSFFTGGSGPPTLGSFDSYFASVAAPAFAWVDPAFANFSPLALSGLVLWLRSDLGVTTSSGNVTTWKDQSPLINSASASVGQQPAYVASGGPNNRPYIQGASGQKLTSATQVLTPGHTRTIWAVIRVGSNSPAPVFEFQVTTPYQALLLTGAGGLDPNYVYTDGASISVTSSTNPNNVGDDRLIEWDMTLGQTPVVFDNGVSLPIVPGAITNDSGAGGYWIGADEVGASFWQGRYYEIIVIDHVASATERALIKAYVIALYGIAVS